MVTRGTLHSQPPWGDGAGEDGPARASAAIDRASKEIAHQRRLPVGAEVVPGGVHFRVWAPQCRTVEVVVGGGTVGLRGEDAPGIALRAEEHGYFSGFVPAAGDGTRYLYRLDEGCYPDPVSRFQPEGPHGPSQIVDPSSFQWTDGEWRGVELAGQVIYELHVGTFTREGTWEAASRELAELAAAGVTVLEMLPVADFPGRFGWGYDGVNLFAPTRLYGEPDDLRRFVDRAHAAGLGVILDVVYNHLGPDGNYLGQFAEEYFTDRYENDWGDAINFDGEQAGPVREFFVANAGYWIDEFHFDGLRLDATQQIFDRSPRHVLLEIGGRVRATAGGRATLLVTENEPQLLQMVRPPERGGYGLDAIWNDDFHHSAMVALTGRTEAYYSDYRGAPQEFISAVKWGCLYQGQRYAWQQARRGTPGLDLPPAAFVTFIQNHDQVANSADGKRCHQLTSPGRYRAMTALLLLGPGTPMLFQGQEFAASSPFRYFADHKPELARLVSRGRRQFIRQFPSVTDPAVDGQLADPADHETFESSKLDLVERERHAEAYALHRDLLKLRRDDPVFRAQRPRGVDGAVLGPKAFVLRFFDPSTGAQPALSDEKGRAPAVGPEQVASPGAEAAAGDRLLIVNFGRELRLVPAPEPLLAPPEGHRWRVCWSSEDPRYGGGGTPPLETEADGWLLPAEAAVVLAADGMEADGAG